MKKRYIVAFVVLVAIAADVFALLYPTVSAYINSQNQSRAVARYLDDVATMDSKDAQALLDAAHEYNERLLHKANRFAFSEEETAQYQRMLDTGRGVMGILVIGKIDVELPIYHGTDAGVLQVGLGHLQGSSLPVGGAGTHAIITGHRGLPSSTLLTDLNKMEQGDTFVLYVMGETLTYQVDQIETVQPQELEALGIDSDKDYCTLVTCTPYGINTHRLLVRGHRIENALNIGWDDLHADANRLDKTRVIVICMIPVLLILMVYAFIKARKIQKSAQ